MAKLCRICGAVMVQKGISPFTEECYWVCSAGHGAVDYDEVRDEPKLEKKAASKLLEEINHPKHYGGDTTYEAIKVIEAWGLGFCLGNAVKYICRADTKGMKLADLKKAVWYISREIQRVENEDNKTNS